MKRLTFKVSTKDGLTKYNAVENKCVDEYKTEKYGVQIGSHIDRLAELENKLESGLLVELHCKVGDTVYRLCKCEDIPHQLDGTMYEFDGSPGTATGYYCPYENCCPFDTDDCDKIDAQMGVFEEVITAIHLGDEEDWIYFENAPNSDIQDIGETVFLTKLEAEAKLKELGGLSDVN
jgi:hypothetical protein